MMVKIVLMVMMVNMVMMGMMVMMVMIVMMVTMVTMVMMVMMTKKGFSQLKKHYGYSNIASCLGCDEGSGASVAPGSRRCHLEESLLCEAANLLHLWPS